MPPTLYTGFVCKPMPDVSAVQTSVPTNVTTPYECFYAPLCKYLSIC